MMLLKPNYFQKQEEIHQFGLRDRMRKVADFTKTHYNSKCVWVVMNRHLCVIH